MPEEFFRSDMPNPTPMTFFDTDIFPFMRKLSVGDKKTINFIGVITEERIMEEDNSKIKRIKILNARPINEEVGRLT